MSVEVVSFDKVGQTSTQLKSLDSLRGMNLYDYIFPVRCSRSRGGRGDRPVGAPEEIRRGEIMDREIEELRKKLNAMTKAQLVEYANERDYWKATIYKSAKKSEIIDKIIGYEIGAIKNQPPMWNICGL